LANQKRTEICDENMFCASPLSAYTGQIMDENKYYSATSQIQHLIMRKYNDAEYKYSGIFLTSSTV